MSNNIRKPSSSSDDPKEQLLYRIVRIVITLAVVLIVGFKVSSMNPEPETADMTKPPVTDEVAESNLHFRSDKLLNDHYEKHGIEMGFESAREYEAAAAAVVSNPRALHKTEKEDGDDVYYVEETNEFVIVSTDGFIRTYFYPSGGIAYYERQ